MVSVSASTLAGVTRRVGILGGTFDPPHIGHLTAAVFCRDARGLDEVRLVVANDPWQKTATGSVSSATERLAMVELAVEELPGVSASDVEIRRGGPTYSIDTVEGFAAEGIELFLIVGADAAAGLDTWHRADELARCVELAVVARSGEAASVPEGWNYTTVGMPRLDVSSSDLRARLARGASLDVLVPASVVTYIEHHDLYPR